MIWDIDRQWHAWWRLRLFADELEASCILLHFIKEVRHNREVVNG